MNNKNITVKERNLLKGAIRRVFSRSELRRAVIDAAVIEGYHDPSRPRVTKWCRCDECKQPNPKYLTECDHLDPLIPLNKRLEDLSWDTVVDRTFCEKNNLRAICKPCHKQKSKLENKQRREYNKKVKERGKK